ncbi:protein kinase [Spiromyces aspiralis]|uniref:Protein kinase n=1 Tax=Spiromyces aspiralis TaxID=68401 RepID=A0ACC1HK44_9FUNG|nr:protein kinase [Spiromyces aspiralis]
MVGPRVVSGTIQRGPPTQMSEKFEVFQDEGDSDEAARESVRTAAQGNEAGGGILSAKTKDKCGDSEDGSTPSDRFLRSIEQQEQQQEQEPAKPLPSDRSAKSEKKPILLPPSSSTSVAKRTGRFCLDFTLLGLANHCQDNPEFELPLCVEEARAQLAQYYFDITKWRHMIQSQREAAKSTSAGASTEYDASQGREEDVLDGDIRLSRKNHRSGENLPSPTINTRVAQAEMFDIWNEQDNEDEGRDNRSDGTTSDDGSNDDDDDDENEEEDDGLNEFERERSMKRLTADASGAKALAKQRSALNDDYQFTMGPVEPNSNPYSSHVADIYSANSASMEQQCANTKSTTRTTPMVVVAASQQAEGSGGCKRRDENDPPTVMIKRMPRDGAGEGTAEPTPQQARAKRSVAPLTVKTPAVSSLAKSSGPATFEVFCDGKDAPAQANLPPASRTPAATSQASEAGHSGGCSDKQQTVVPWHSTPALGSRRRGYDYEEMITGMSQVGIDPNSGQTMSTIHPVSGGLTTAMLGGNNATHTFGVTGEYDVAEEVTGTMHPHVVVTNINANLDTPATAIRTRHNAQSVGITPRFPASRICQDPIGEEDEDEDEDVGDGDEWQKNSEENAVVIDDNVLMSSQMDGGGSASKAKTIAPSTFMFYLGDDDGRSGSKHPDSPLEDKSSFIKTVRPTNKSPPPFKVYSACPDNGEEGEGDEDEEGGGNDESTTTTATDNQDFTGAPGRPSLQDQPQEGRTEQDQHPTIVKPFWPLERSVYLVILDAAPEPVEFFAGYCNCYEHPLREALKSTQDQLRIIMTTDAAGTAGGKGPKPITLSAFNDDEEDEEEDMEFQRLRQRLRVRTVPLHLGLKDQPDTAPYRRFEVERMLKEGGNAVVYLAMNAAEEQEEMAQCVLKVESPPNMWEFFILNTLKDRMAEAAKMFASNTPTFASAEWVVMPECVYEYSDYSVTVLPYCAQGSLLDVVNAWNQAAVLEIHRLGCVHTDLKAENVMLNLTDAMLSDPSCVLSAKVPANPSALDEGFEPQSPCSLVRLIDFGRAIDWTVFDPLQQLRVHDINHDDKVRAGGNQTDPVELDEVPAWSPHADWVGVAKIAHLLLFGCRLRTQPIDALSCLRDVIRPGKVPRDIVKTTTTTLRRYWQTDLWRRLFAICLSGFPEPTAIDPSLGPAINVDAVWKGDLKQRIEPAMLELLQDMESWLVEWYIKRRSDVDRGLPSLLRRLYLKTSAYCV